MTDKFKYTMANWLRSIVNRIFPDNVNADTSYEDMPKAIENWLALYYNEPYWLEKVHNHTLNLGAGIATEFARLIMIEFDSQITGSKRADYLNEQYTNLILNLRHNLEEACAIGGFVLKPYVENGKIKTDFVTQDRFIPVAWSDDEITSAIFIDRKYANKQYYFRIEKQTYDSTTQTHRIESRFFKSTSPEKIGKEIQADEFPSYIDPDITFNNVDRPLFAFWRTPFANTTNKESPLGISVYSRALKLIEQADYQWDRFLWEFEGGTLAIDADESLLRTRPMSDKDGNQIRFEMPKAKDRLFRTLKGSSNATENLYKVFSPALRDNSFLNGLNKIFRQIEFACSLAYGTISDPQNVDKTAEEIKASKQRSFSVVSDMQTSLQNTLKHYIYAMNEFATGCKLAPQGEYDIKFNWGDGVLEDTDKETQIRLQEVNSGISSKIEYRMWRYGETEEQAEQALQKQSSGVVDFFGG